MYGLQLGFGGGPYGGRYGGHLIEQNEFFDCHEGVHIKTTDNIIRGNYIHDLQSAGWMGIGCGVFLRSCPRTTVENNRIERPNGIGIRVCGNDQVIRNNLTIDADIGIWLNNLSWGRARNSNWIVHNTIDATLGVWVSTGEALIYNNIFVGNDRSKMTVFAAGLGTNPVEKLRPSWYKAYSGTDAPEAHFIAGYNLVAGTAPMPPLYPASVTERDKRWDLPNFFGDPQFISPENGDYRLGKNSPARKAGRQLPNCSYDIKGHLRNLESPDVGAYESKQTVIISPGIQK